MLYVFIAAWFMLALMYFLGMYMEHRASQKKLKRIMMSWHALLDRYESEDIDLMMQHYDIETEDILAIMQVILVVLSKHPKR